MLFTGFLNSCNSSMPRALSSLANFAYLNPGYTFPQIQVNTPPQPSSVFQAQGLGHPLIPV